MSNKTIKFTDKQAEKFITKQLKRRVTKKQAQLLVFHSIAVNFLSHHFDTARFDDSVVTNLRSLLRDQFNAGIAYARKETKKRK